jgi:hypothetical protein
MRLALIILNDISLHIFFFNLRLLMTFGIEFTKYCVYQNMQEGMGYIEQIRIVVGINHCHRLIEKRVISIAYIPRSFI